MDTEGLRLGMFLGGVVMAFFPVLIGVALTVFLVREYRHERERGREQAAAESAEGP